MTNERYYYDDPLAVAWMEDRFGMKLGRPNDDLIGGWEEFVAPDEITCFYCGMNVEKIYIHPDSVHLLEPQEGDVVGSGLGNYYFLCGNSGIYGTPILSLPLKIGRVGMKQLQIIQRNGIPFHFPKDELVTPTEKPPM